MHGTLLMNNVQFLGQHEEKDGVLGVGGMVLPAMALMKQHRAAHHDYDARLL